MSTPDEEIAEAIERAKRLGPVRGKPRYGRGPRSIGRVRVYCRPAMPKILDFRFDYDIIERMYQLRDGREETFRMPKRVEKLMRLEFLTFIQTGMPACLIRIDRYFHPTGPKVTRLENGWQFRSALNADKIGVRRGIPSQELDYFWWERERGIVAIFPDEHMINIAEKPDVRLEFGLSDGERVYDGE